MGQAISLGWIGPSIAVYADDDPFWNDLAKVKEEEARGLHEQEHRPRAGRRAHRFQQPAEAGHVPGFGADLHRTDQPGADPLGVAEVQRSRLRPHLAGQRLEHGVPQDMENLAIYYTTRRRSVDHHAQRTGAATGDRSRSWPRNLPRSAARAAAKPAEAPHPWLGSNVALHVDSRILEIGNLLGREQYQQQMQVQCWNNLPILNEWKRLFPDRDPVAVHRQVWGVTLLCPGGGKYVWNEKYRHDGIDRLRPPRRAERRPARPRPC